MTYQQLLERKAVKAPSFGIEPKDTSPALFDFQVRATEFALRQGRAALFLDTGLGKTICQLEWARQIPGRKLILTPPAVAPQTVREGQSKLGIEIEHCKTGESKAPIVVTNYERLHLFDPSRFDGVILDESSILKAFSGKTSMRLRETFQHHPYRLACTATPSPNDHTELGQHAEFLGVMPTGHMLARWFINDSANTGDWRLKGHARDSFWQWVASWSVSASKPSDLGGDDTPFAMPPLNIQTHVVQSKLGPDIDSGTLFGFDDASATSIHQSKRQTFQERIARAVELATHGDPCIIWCETNPESAALAKRIADCVEVVGSDDIDEKEAKLDAFTTGQVRCIVTKASIAGFGLNWQHCAHQVFASISFSYEAFYQAVRRCWRFGQKRPVTADVVISDAEQSVWRVIREKQASHNELKSAIRNQT